VIANFQRKPDHPREARDGRQIGRAFGKLDVVRARRASTESGNAASANRGRYVGWLPEALLEKPFTRSDLAHGKGRVQDQSDPIDLER
jgi:hypothetical protein